jgi:hypothetical protein
MRTIALSAVAICILMGTAASAQKHYPATVYPETQYVSGKEGFTRSIKGQLVIDEHEIAFRQNDGTAVFAISMKSVLAVSNRVETDPGSVGRKALLGVFATRREEFLTVSAHGPNGTETIVFKAKRKTSDGMVGKVQFYQRRASAD